MYWPVLIVANIPVYLFVGWLVFDTKGKAAETIFQTVLAVLRAILLPGFVRVLMGAEDEGSPWDLFLFIGGCTAIVWGEHLLLTKFVFGGTPG